MVDIQSSRISSRCTHNSDVENQIEKLCSKVKQLKYTTVEIRDEIKHQNADLTEDHGIMDLTSNLIGQTRSRVTRLSKSDWKMYSYLILFALFIFLIIYSFIK